MNSAGETKGGRFLASTFPWLLFVTLLSLDVGAQIIEKLASVRADGQGLGLLVSFASQPWVWIVLAIKVGQLFTWTAILRRVDLSLAFPLTAIAYPLTMIASVFCFNERLSPQIWLGGVLITVGAIVMGPTQADTASDRSLR